MANSPLSQKKVFDRRQLVERLYLEGIAVPRIVEACRRKFGTARQRNIQNDVCIIRKRWKEQAANIFGGDVTSWWIQLALSDRRTALRDGDTRLAYTIAKDIAKMAGVNILDIVIGGRQEVEQNAISWADLMNQERERKKLEPAEFQVVDAMPVEVKSLPPASDKKTKKRKAKSTTAKLRATRRARKPKS